MLTPPLPLPPRSRRLRDAVANALPQRCHRCQRAAEATVALPAAAALLPRCHSRRRAVAPAAGRRCRQAAAAAAFVFIVVVVAVIVAVSDAVAADDFS